MISLAPSRIWWTSRLGRLFIERARRAPEDRARRLERSRNVGDAELQRLEVGDAAAERLALAHVSNRLVERRLPAASPRYAAGAETVPTDGETM